MYLNQVNIHMLAICTSIHIHTVHTTPLEIHVHSKTFVWKLVQYSENVVSLYSTGNRRLDERKGESVLKLLTHITIKETHKHKYIHAEYIIITNIKQTGGPFQSVHPTCNS